MGPLKTQGLGHDFLWPPGGRVCQVCRPEGEVGFYIFFLHSGLSHSQEDQAGLHSSLISVLSHPESWPLSVPSLVSCGSGSLALLLEVYPMSHPS